MFHNLGPSFKHVFSIIVENSVDPGQMTYSVFKKDKFGLIRTKVKFWLFAAVELAIRGWH